MSKQIKNPGIIVKNILKRHSRYLKDGYYDAKQSIGDQMPCEDNRYLQPLFMRDFTEDLNSKFYNSEFESLDLVNYLLDQKVNPLDLDEFQKIKYGASSYLRILSFKQVYSNEICLSLVKKWDAVFKRISETEFPYKINNELIGSRSLSIGSRIINAVLDNRSGFSRWLIKSPLFADYMTSWSKDVVKGSIDSPSKKIESILKGVGDLYYLDHYPFSDDQAASARSMLYKLRDSMEPLQDTVQLSNIESEEDDYRYLCMDSIVNLFEVAYPDLDERHAFAQDFMRINDDYLRLSILKSVISNPVLAVDLAAQINSKSRSLALLTRAISQQLYSLGCTEEKINLSEEFRRAMSGYGFPDLKECSEIQGIVTSAECIIMFGKLGYKLDTPSFHNTYFFGDERKIGGSLSDEVIDSISDNIIKACQYLNEGFLELNIEKNFLGQNTILPHNLMGSVTKRAIEQGVIDIEKIIRTEARVDKVLNYGVSIEVLSNLKAFKKSKKNIIRNDLGI